MSKERIIFMSNIIRKAVAVAVCLVLLISCLAGCAQKGKPFMTLEGEKISVNTYMLFLSRVKGTLCSSTNFGSAAKQPSFWDVVMDSDGMTTYNDYYCDMVLDSAKAYLAAMYIFEQEGLKLPDEYKDAIKEEMDRLVETDGKGSKATLNSLLAQYGANYDVLREAYTLEAKIAYLKDHLYGDNGSKIASSVIEGYYQANYVKFRHVFLYTYEVIYEKDVNGDDIYYTDDGRIAYDTTRHQKVDENGAFVRDENQDVIYINRDGSIAYDTKNGKRMPELDDKGYAVTRDYEGEELRKVLDMAQIIMENTIEDDENTFDSLVEKYNEDVGMDEFPNGYYITKNTDYPEEVKEALFEMEEGDIRQVRSENGIHIVMKYKLDKGGYAKKSNVTFFADSDGNYLFMDALKEQLLNARIEQYLDEIEIKEELIENVDMKSVDPNYDY